MSFSDLIRWLSADWTHAVTAAGLLALGYALAWAAIRASYERVVGKPMPRTRLVLVLDVLADLAVNVPGAVNRLLRSTGRDPLFLPAPPPRASAPSGRSGQSGRADVGALVVLAAVGLVGVTACPRAREAVLDTQSPRVACAPTSQRCHDGAPEVCSATGRWWPAMPPQDDGTPRRCAVACEVVEGVARCGGAL
jgi:hypothetical protein